MERNSCWGPHGEPCTALLFLILPAIGSRGAGCFVSPCANLAATQPFHASTSPSGRYRHIQGSLPDYLHPPTTHPLSPHHHHCSTSHSGVRPVVSSSFTPPPHRGSRFTSRRRRRLLHWASRQPLTPTRLFSPPPWRPPTTASGRRTESLPGSGRQSGGEWETAGARERCAARGTTPKREKEGKGRNGGADAPGWVCSSSPPPRQCVGDAFWPSAAGEAFVALGWVL